MSVRELHHFSLEEAIAWRDAAVADGWAIRPTYAGHESVERAATLERDGWVALVYTRPRRDRMLQDEVSISVWGPDRLAVEPGPTYSREQLLLGLTTCGYCGAEGVTTRRVGFAGRCCDVCLPVVGPRVEFPGWTK